MRRRNYAPAQSASATSNQGLPNSRRNSVPLEDQAEFYLNWGIQIPIENEAGEPDWLFASSIGKALDNVPELTSGKQSSEEWQIISAYANGMLSRYLRELNELEPGEERIVHAFPIEDREERFAVQIRRRGERKNVVSADLAADVNKTVDALF